MNFFEKKWQTVCDMAHEARENGGSVWLEAANGNPSLMLIRQGPITRFYISGYEVSGGAFADSIGARSEQDQATEGDDLITVYSELPATELTKRELAEIHVLAGVLASIPDSSDAVDRTTMAVGILMDEWQERDGNA